MAPIQRVFLVVCGLTVLSGCAFQKTVTPVVSENDPVMLRLADAAGKASRALDNIAAVEQFRTPAPPPDDFSGAPEVLMRAVTVNWSGPAEVIAKTLADRAGYHFNVAGSLPPVPIVVTVNAYEQPLVRVLRDIGLQLGQRADLVVNAQQGAIDLRYAAVDMADVR